MSVPHPYRAPREEGVLCYPPEADIAQQLQSNRALLNDRTVRIDGTPLADFRLEAIAEILAAARQYFATAASQSPTSPMGRF